jgi:hypothetical protein
MAQTKSPLLLPTSHPAGYAGEAPRDQAVLQSDRRYWERELIYGAPSVVPSTMVVRVHASEFQPYAAKRELPDYAYPVAWLTRTPVNSVGPINSSVAWQRNRTFGGVSPNYYQPLAAPSLDEVSRYMGGLVNG